MEAKLAAVRAAAEHPVDPATGRPFFHPATGRAPHHRRNQHGLPVGDYLYGMRSAFEPSLVLVTLLPLTLPYLCHSNKNSTTGDDNNSNNNNNNNNNNINNNNNNSNNNNNNSNNNSSSNNNNDDNDNNVNNALQLMMSCVPATQVLSLQSNLF